jgi:SPX domain protein involved in polyphosphate accumulation
MSFRIEEKLFIKKNFILDFKKFINLKALKKIYDSRIIESLYFENKNQEMFNDSIEGTVPRKKIRVRYYPKQGEKLFFEKKISSVEGRFKERKLIDLKMFNYFKKNGILDNQYGLCMPKIYVTYKRDYFKINDVRITIDENIVYKNYKTQIKKNDGDTIIELKTHVNKNLDELVKDFPFQKIRFSKYCKGLEKLN